MTADDLLVLEPRPVNLRRRLAILATGLALGALQAAELARQPGDIAATLVFVLSAAAVLVSLWRLARRDPADRRRLRMDHDGFSVGGHSYRWPEVRGFGVQKDFRTLFTDFRDNKKIYWTFGDSGLADVDSDDYTVPPERIAALLNERLRARTGRATSVSEGPKFFSQLLRPTVFYLRNYLLLSSAAIWLLLRLWPAAGYRGF